jgi:predicted outer membrane repeat protein
VRADTTGEVTLDGDGSHHLLNVNAANLSVEGIDFHDGEAYNGGAIYVANDLVDDVLTGGSLEVLDSIFTSNEADGEFGSGGAIYVEGSLTVNHSSFEDSLATYYGGAIYVYGADYEDEQTIIADVEFHGNYADEGGAIAVIDSQMTVIRAEFTANGANEGGAIYVYDTNWSVSHSTFGSASDDHDDPDYENYANHGGDIYSGIGIEEPAVVTGSVTHSKFYDSYALNNGASLYMECTALNLSNSLFHSTEAYDDGVIFMRDSYGEGDACDDYRATISRSTFSSNFVEEDAVIFVEAGSEEDGISGLLSLSVTNSTFTDNVVNEDEGVFDVNGPVDISIINSRFERNSAGDDGAIIQMDGGDDDSSTTNGSLTFSRNQVRFNTAGTDSSTGDGMIQLDDVHSWQIDYNTFQGNSADRGAVLAFEVDDDDLRDLIQLNGFRRNTIIGNSASVGGSYLFIQYNDNASNVKRASIKRIEQQVKKNRNIIKGGTRPAVLQLLDFLDED